MKKFGRLTIIALVVLAGLSVIAVVLQIFNHKTGPVETAYEIITFFVAAVALTIAVLQGIYNAHTDREMKKMIEDISRIMEMEEKNMVCFKEISNNINEELEIERKIISMLEKTDAQNQRLLQ